MTTNTETPTPRTDKAEGGKDYMGREFGIVPADFARQLEQELAAAQEANMLGGEQNRNLIRQVESLNDQLRDVKEQLREAKEQLRRSFVPAERAGECINLLEAAGMGRLHPTDITIHLCPHGNTLTGMTMEICEKYSAAIALAESNGKKCGEIRSVLQTIANILSVCSLGWQKTYEEVKHALSSDCGKDFVPRAELEKVEREAYGWQESFDKARAECSRLTKRNQSLHASAEKLKTALEFISEGNHPSQSDLSLEQVLNAISERSHKALSEFAAAHPSPETQP